MYYKITCPQCGYFTADKNAENGHVTCGLCGYTKENNIESKGYGSIHINNDIELFKNPLSILEKQNKFDIVSKIPKSSLFIWDDINGLIAIKGEMPKKYNDFLQQKAEEQKYYRQFNISSSIEEDDEEF
jgi:hypothetical protein